jgi:hypothetical protein
VGGHHVVVACGVTDTAAKCMDPACGGFRDFRYGHFQRKGMLIVGWPR